MDKPKPYLISKQLVFDAWLAVRKNAGASGVDKETIVKFEQNLKANLYKIWNRMSSGTWFPPMVRGVEIPKKQGGARLLGIPTVSDRVAQMVVKMQIEPAIDPIFHDDSYAYRPNKSAHQALEVTSKRCWQHLWVLEFDIRKMFDTIPHDLLIKAIIKHVPDAWCRLYIERWLKSDIQMPDGQVVNRTSGTPQGGVISPILSNLFMHYAFDMWITREFNLKWCRFADDGIIHCQSKKQAEFVLNKLQGRLKDCGLELHSEKTKIVYCGTEKLARKDNYNKFTFLGYTFRLCKLWNKSKGCVFVKISPVVSDEALNAMRETIRKEWRISIHTNRTLEQIAQEINATVRGWYNYYSKFSYTHMRVIARYLDQQLVGWLRRRHKFGRGKIGSIYDLLRKLYHQNPNLFVHWKYNKVY